ncbi:MAG: UvrD-helicase domain-containing protein [Bacteroidales bacterium]|nr:UvrD-helicase domain-containing protein [Bacteroidales bacterium]
MLKILKASAGSGKTYSLTEEYIRLLVKEDRPDAYRHILAVTFTNKATDEMKRRILKELYTLAKEPEKSPYLNDFVPDPVSSTEELQRRSGRQLSLILHDYSSFAVSTIDRFFQQTLRAFSREIGQFSSYQVQLDREQLVSESVDLVLDNLQEGETLEWLTSGARKDLERTGRFSLEDRLTKMATSLRELPEGSTILPQKKLEELDGLCADLISSFRASVSKAAKGIIDTCQRLGFLPEDTSSRWLCAVRAYLKPEEDIQRPKEGFMNRAADSSKWFTKANNHLLDISEAELAVALNAFTSLFDKPYREYVTAITIREQVYTLGVADSLRSAFTEIQKEKNVISIDEGNTILHGIIDGTDAPFIYEKLGVRFDNFLLDEFQDTANIQWENFLPLLKGSESTGGNSLVVGDVKQSIYRWRGSDWRLLGSRLGLQFPRAEYRRLDGNYRTLGEIVDFNNSFFQFAASELDRLLGQEGPESLSSLYADVKQSVKVDETAPGLVEVVFTDEQETEIINSLKGLSDKGVDWSSMAILVRGNAEGSSIASALVSNGIPVVSDDSLFVKSSVTVRRLVSQLSLADNPGQEGKSGVPGYLAGEMNISARESFNSLSDLAEELLREIRTFDEKTFDAEVPYIQAFMDYLQDWVSTGGNNLGAFLKAWKDASPKISSPSTGNAVRVMTVHKAKGLEFPFVIFPYAEKVNLYKAEPRWCSPALEGSHLEGKAEGLYNVNLDSRAADSLFSQTVTDEQALQAVDNINVFYVALTRAKYGLKVIGAKPPKVITDALAKGLQPQWKNLSQLLYAFVGSEVYRSGELYIPEKKEKEGPGVLLIDSYPSFPACSEGRLSFSPEAADYFGEDGEVGILASRRIRGNVLHGILSGILTAEDIPAAVAVAVNDGSLPENLKADTIELLSSRIASVQDRGWFSPGVKVLCEASVIGADGREWRPDRVVLTPDGVSIIDYKFGEEDPRYTRQVLRYMDLYRKMGYTKVRGFLWYFQDNRIKECVQDNRI